jgi:hypothetical protein
MATPAGTLRRLQGLAQTFVIHSQRFGELGTRGRPSESGIGLVRGRCTRGWRVGADLMVDLGDLAAGAIRIAAEGVTHDPNGKLAFRRPAGMAPLPIPVLGGSHERLRHFINVDDDDWPRVAAWPPSAPKGLTPCSSYHGV